MTAALKKKAYNKLLLVEKGCIYWYDADHNENLRKNYPK